MTQATRYLQIRLQKTPPSDWRPSLIMITPRTFDRSAPVQLMDWLCDRHGFGTYLHYMEGLLEHETYRESREVQERLVRAVQERRGAIYVDTMISPSIESAIAQSLQMPGVSGMENNTILFEYGAHDGPEVLEELLSGLKMSGPTQMNRLVLRHGDNFFGSRRSIHVWLTWHDARNANLMILLTYILLGTSGLARGGGLDLRGVSAEGGPGAQPGPAGDDRGGTTPHQREEHPRHCDGRRHRLRAARGGALRIGPTSSSWASPVIGSSAAASRSSGGSPPCGTRCSYARRRGSRSNERGSARPRRPVAGPRAVGRASSPDAQRCHRLLLVDFDCAAFRAHRMARGRCLGAGRGSGAGSRGAHAVRRARGEPAGRDRSD